MGQVSYLPFYVRVRFPFALASNERGEVIFLSQSEERFISLTRRGVLARFTGSWVDVNFLFVSPSLFRHHVMRLRSDLSLQQGTLTSLWCLDVVWFASVQLITISGTFCNKCSRLAALRHFGNSKGMGAVTSLKGYLVPCGSRLCLYGVWGSWLFMCSWVYTNFEGPL